VERRVGDGKEEEKLERRAEGVESYGERNCQGDVWSEREREEEDLAAKIDGEEALLLQRGSCETQEKVETGETRGNQCYRE
jgi:hypothetical protein